MPDNMGVNDIAFPHLGIYLRNLPKSFSVFGFEIAFYGLIIGIGVMLGVLMAVQMAKKEEMDTDYMGFWYLCGNFFRHRGKNLLCGLFVGFIQGQSSWCL